ncbi:MAG: Mur ligase family protein, partial [Candidatus Saccharicenans sp.]
QVAVITTISYDHQQYLGNSLEKIAFEKAGIIKENTPCVCGVKNLRALRVIRKKCREVQARLIEVFGQGKKFTWDDSETGLVFRYDSGRQIYCFKPSLPGLHQGENAAVAIAVTEVMEDIGWQINKDKVIEGIETTSWPGRLEVFS